MKRRLGQVGVRVAAVAFLLAGLVGGVHLGQDRDDDLRAVGAVAQVDPALVAAEEARLLAERESRREAEHAAARARQRQAQTHHAKRAATVAKAAAVKSRKTETAKVERKKAEEKKKQEEARGPVPFDGPIPASCNEFSGSRAIGCSLMLARGFGIEEFPCLNQLWKKESGWNYKAENRSSGAYGIPQALPGSKMKSAGSDWRTNPATQIKWGLGYIKGRYDSPCGAWNYFQNEGHY